MVLKLNVYICKMGGVKWLCRLIRLLWIFITHYPIKTIYFNFKMLPFRQAKYLPIFIYGKTEFRSLRGKIIIKGKLSPNMIHIGDNTRYPHTNRSYSVWTINGTIVFLGRMNFYNGTYVYVAQNAVLSFGTHGTFVGSDTKIICRELITIGNNVEITWENQIYDTSFHYVRNQQGKAKRLTSPIVIHDNVWVGNRSTIAKGTILPSYSIVASNSMTNKDFSEYGECCLFAGMPAICKVKEVKRVFDSSEEKLLDKEFGYIRFKL